MRKKNFFNFLIFIIFCISITNCQVLLNPCINSHCKNLAKCIPLNEFNYTCECNSIYWSGRYCDQATDKNPCYWSPCRMNSSCLHDETLNKYKCLCQPGYTGTQCDQIIDVCQSFPCKNRGLCTNINYIGNRQANYYRCSCQPGFTGANCDIIVDQCSSNPCLNFGICISKIDSYECICLPSYNGTRCENDYSLNSYSCTCQEGFYGNKCQIQLNQCADTTNPCNNNGICESVPSFGLPYTCHCLPGFTGKNCEIKIDLCAENPCKFGGTCTMPNAYQYKCDCPKGTLGINCEVNYDECQSSPCLNNGTCIETSLNSYSCMCPNRRTGVNCEILTSECLPDTCKNGGLCLDTSNGPFCLCLDGFSGIHCEINLSACNSIPCQHNGTCIPGLNNTYRCACRPPFTGVNCEQTFDACTIFNPCLNSASCISNGTLSKCQCSSNYTGKYCEYRLSICETNPCNSRGKCYEDMNGSYKCFCNRGFTGQNCSDTINACLSNPCKNNATCEQMLNDYKCTCPIGFTSKRCEVELNPCDSNPCFNDGICYNNFNYYNCTCPPDYSGRNCELSRDPCLFMNNCSGKGVCQNRFGVGVCLCNDPFYGEYCQFSIDYCLSRPCQNAGRCQMSNGTSYNCTCTVGFTGVNCETVIDPCENYCLNNGTCFLDAKLMIACQCPCEYEGLRCEKKINYCNTSSHCQNGKCIQDGCGYKCECDCGYNGQYCDIPIDQCAPNPDGSPKCLNNGNCTSNGCGFSCNCTRGFTGERCQIRKSLCASDTCLNGASCVDIPNDYVCNCPCKYYSGKNCQSYKEICLEKGNECLNGATCISKGCNFECLCSNGYSGKHCDLKLDPCSSSPCYNNGFCHSGTNNYTCTCLPPYTGSDCSQLINPITPCSSSPCEDFKICIEKNSTSYVCECPPFYIGDRCEARVRACLNSPCNGGQCLEDALNGGFKCVCPIGMTGQRCEKMIDTCVSQPCLNNASCTQLRPNTFKCHCPPSLTGTLCQFRINPCLSFPCLNRGACSISDLDPTKYVCNCSGICHTGSRCETEINTCSSNNCNGKGTCINLGSCNTRCLCQPGWTGNNCETQIDICKSQPCANNATCINNGNNWYCKCAPGFTGHRCTNYLLSCSSSPCENGGYCSEILSTNSYSCTCMPGWTGLSCEIDINECEKSPCQNSGTCIEDRINSFKCICPRDYSGQFCEQLIDLCQSQPCLNSAQCISNLNGTFSCKCANGYYGSRCEYETNECSSNPCLNHGLCIDKVNAYECRCPSEFTGVNCNISTCINYCLNGGICFIDLQKGNLCLCQKGFKGQRCELIDDPCDSNPCLNENSECISRYYGHYECTCDYGYTGKFCEIKIDSCVNNPCVRGNCYTNTYGIVKCLCPPGFTGRYCEINLGVCEPINPCLNGGLCKFSVDYNASVCPEGVTGQNCEIPLDVCASNPCKSEHATCVQNGLNSFECICPPFQTGKYCETSINLCDPNPCPLNIKCQQISYTETKCVCPPGFTGTKCTERLNVCESNPCIKGTCVSPLPGIFRCNCQKGYKGLFCHESIVLCDSVTCLNGGYCLSNSSLSNGFQCVCPNGYTGIYCETPIDPCKTSQINLCGTNGICKYISPGEYVCKCNSNCYYGKSCELTYDPCSMGKCKNSGKCFMNQTNCSYKCDCLPGFDGTNCEYNTDPCLTTPTPCFNGGSCVNNGTSSYYCQCDVNYSGKYCEYYTNPCNGRACLNGGVCVIDPYYSQAVCVCQHGFTGLECASKIDYCSSSPCLNNGKCVNMNTTFMCECANGFGGQYCQEQIDYCALLNPCVYGNCFRGSPGNYSCFCFEGWTGKNCDSQILYCNSNPCINGLCVNHIGGYTCQCSSGYSGPDCSSTFDSCLSNPCVNGICLSVFNSLISNTEYKCFCDSGYTGSNCDTKLDLCLNNGDCKNNGVCKQVSTGFAYCDCPQGYEGQYCETITNLCGKVTCYNGGSCEFLGLNKFKCNCLPGFSGSYCQIQNDLCIPNPCLNKGNCTTGIGFYNCKCPSNYGGVNCQFSQKCDSNPCENSGLCTKLFDGSFKCDCPPGFTGLYCDRIINACNSNPCLNGASCFRYNFTNYLCSCASGYKGTTCNQDVDECQMNICKNNGACQNTIGSYKCTCKPGYTGIDCSDIIIDACIYNECSQNGTTRCVQTNFGIYTCVCKEGYAGQFCQNKVSPCESSPCINNGICQNSPDSLSFACSCPKEYFGNRCEFNADYCSVYRPCGPFGICKNLNSSNYQCQCLPGFTGKNCEILIDTCLSKPCLNSATCVSSINYYTCLCPPSHFGTNCENPVDKCNQFPCYNGGTCINTFNTTFCQCNIGFTGAQCQFNQNCLLQCKNGGVCNTAGDACICPSNFNSSDCSFVIDKCLSNPCKNNAKCKQNTTAYTCECTSGYSGRNCEIQSGPCDLNPCSGNGQCLSLNSTSFECKCFTPYSGTKCENRLDLCSFINCGQGTCKLRSNESAYCECLPGYNGNYCQIRIQACLSSPCQNGGNCVEGVNGTFTCKCAPEYTGPKCETILKCVETFDYCSSLPCLNGGKCFNGPNCSLTCNCSSSFYGDFCQFSSEYSIFSSNESISIIQSCDTDLPIDFKMELQPCLIEAWKESNPQFSCPNGYEMISNISDRCFRLKTFTNSSVDSGIDKLKADYECQINGASLVTFDTRQKLESIIDWLKSKSLINNNSSINIWTASAIYRENAIQNESNWYWVWASRLTNKIQKITYDNWGAFQEKNFNGDSIYLNTSDQRFYVNLSQNNLTGFICESNVFGLQDNDIQIIELNQSSVFTSLSQTAIRIDYNVNIATNETTATSVRNQVRQPNSTFLKAIIKNSCYKQAFIENVDGKIYSFDKLFSIDICGDLNPNHNEFIRKALVDSWLTARPEFVWCTTERNCLAVNILKTKVIYIDYWNKITRVYYSIRINDVLIEPGQVNISPTSEIMRTNIEKIRKNFYSNYLLCGILIDSKTNETYIQSTSIRSQSFPLAVNNFVVSSSIFTKPIIEAAITNSFYSSSGIDRFVLQINAQLMDEYEDILVLSEFYPNLPLNRFNINPSQITYPASLLSFRIIINGSNLSPATQGVLDENQFYFLIQQELFANNQLRMISLTSFLLNVNQPFFRPDKSFFKLQLTTNVIDMDMRFIENEIKNFIKQHKIEFKHCTKCWNDNLLSSFTVKYVHTHELIDHKANEYYELWFAVVVRNEYEYNSLTIVTLDEENDFKIKFDRNKQYLYEKINSIPISYNNGKKFYSVNVKNQLNTRSLSKAIKLNLNQSILHEDVLPIVEMLKRSITLIGKNGQNRNFQIDYWGQNEYVKLNSINDFDTYWQAYFYVRSVNESNLVVYEPRFDYLIGNLNIDNFFSTYKSARSNLFINKINYDSQTDYSSEKDLFYVQCFGSIFPEYYEKIMEILTKLWSLTYESNDDELSIQSTFNLKWLDGLTIRYVGQKGSYSVIPYVVEAFDNGRLIKRDLYKQPEFDALRLALINYCDVREDMSSLHREDSLNYIEAIGTLTIDQAKQYLPAITFAHMSYFSLINSNYEPNVQMSRPSEIFLVENFISTNMMIITKIYYNIYANTTFDYNLYNYEIKNTKYKITSNDYNFLFPILSRNVMRKNFARIDLMDRAKIQNINLILAWLPKFSIELEYGKELSIHQKLNIEKALETFWSTCYSNLNKTIESIEVELAYSKGYFNINTNTYSTLIYYIIALNGLVKYETELPRSFNESYLNKELNKIGFRMSQKQDSNTQIRSIYIDTNQRPIELNDKIIQQILKQCWTQYINETNFSLIKFGTFNIQLKVIEQSLFYDKEKQLLGIKYALSVNDLDPSVYMIMDLPKYYLESKMSPFSVVANVSLLARRMYVYSGRLKNEKTIINNDLMKDKISDLWRSKNLPKSNLQNSNVVYQTGFYKAESGNFYSNFFDVSFYRITYTQSINGIEPSSLFYQSPNELDFDNEFLNDLGQNLMGFCFKDCFNYKQSGILIKKHYASNSKLLEIIKNTWINKNQVDSYLVNKNDIEISFITNKRSFKSIDTSTGLSIVLFNVKLNSKYTFNQIDSFDLKEPTKDDYLIELSQLYPEISPKDVHPIVDISVIKETHQNGYPSNTTSQSVDTIENVTSPKQQSNWWQTLLIIIACLIILTCLIVFILYLVRKSNTKNSKSTEKKNSQLLRNDNESDNLSQIERDYGKFTILANTFPQGELNDLYENDEDPNETLNRNLSIQEPIFNTHKAIMSPAISRIKENDKIVYPGLTIDDIVPNPIYTKSQVDSSQQEKFITSIYVTGCLSENEIEPKNNDSN